ncbi:MAG: nitroreductase family protein [Actinomycetia bacterium]|nr:nitroreductase family protein [Actinomycetes bacterium]MCP4959595.1 nitroreductase family protein [Actinomycetes bacterium]
MSEPVPVEVGLLEGMATTRAIRRYADEPIPEDDLATIMWHATRAPSGSNRQPFRFLVLRDGPNAVVAKRILGESFRAAWNHKRSTDGYADGTGVDASSPKARMATTMQHYVDNFEKVPVVVLACMNRHRAASPFEGASVYPACQNLLLAARALGYGGVLTGWHGLVESELRDLFGLPEETTISATITLGRPVGSHGPVRRRRVQELVYDDEWGSGAEWAVDPEGTRVTNSGPPGSPR